MSSTSNAFALLATEASDSKVVKAEKKKKEAPKKVAKKPAPAPAPAKKEAPAKPPTEVRGSKVPDSALERKRGERAPGKKLAIQRTGNRPPKRQFDRHDGTGRAHEGMKKNGAGRGNWGKATEHGAEEEKPQEEKPQEEKEQKEEKKPEPELTEEEKALKELREKQRTLEQYQSKQNSGKAVLHTAAPVEVECSVDEKNFAPITRVDLVAEQEKIIAAEKAPKKAAKAEKAAKKAPKEEKAKIEIQFNEGRREHHKEAAKPVKLSTSDEKAFPSLA